MFAKILNLLNECTAKEWSAARQAGKQIYKTIDLAHKPEDFSDADSTTVPADLVKDMQGVEFSSADVLSGGNLASKFKPEFLKKNPKGDPFIMTHKGKKYYIDPSGYSYARYAAKIK